MKRAASILCLTVAAVACSDPVMTDPPDGLSPGIIGRNGAARLEVPASAVVGDTITVAVYT